MKTNAQDEFAKLVEVISILRSPNGCPWDKEQTHDSLKNHAIEETYEMIEAIESGNPQKLADELGDVLLQVLLHSQIASETDDFDISDVCRKIREKLIRRHPHVFQNLEVSGIDEIWKNWEQIKREETGHEDRKSALDGIPNTMPALMRANKISKNAARTGFDWPNLESVLEKLEEETTELQEAIQNKNDEHIKEEIGDMIFTLVNIARFQNIDPEEALRGTISKFTSRFSHIEKHAKNTNRDIHDLSMDEMEEVWGKAKG